MNKKRFTAESEAESVEHLNIEHQGKQITEGKLLGLSPSGLSQLNHWTEFIVCNQVHYIYN